MSSYFVEFSQQNGIVCHGEVLAEVPWDGEQMYLLRYWQDPEGDAPRKPYTLEPVSRCRRCKLPRCYVKVTF